MKRNGAQGFGSDELLNCLSGDVWATGKKTNTISELRREQQRRRRQKCRVKPGAEGFGQ